MKKSIQLGVAALFLAGGVMAHTIHVTNSTKQGAFSILQGSDDILTVKFCPKNIFKSCNERLVLKPVAEKQSGQYIENIWTQYGSYVNQVNEYGYETVSGNLTVPDDSTDIMVIAEYGKMKLWTDDPICLRANKIELEQSFLNKSTCDGQHVKWHFRAFGSFSENGQ